METPLFLCSSRAMLNYQRVIIVTGSLLGYPPMLSNMACWKIHFIESKVMNSYWNLHFVCGIPIAMFDYQGVLLNMFWFNDDYWGHSWKPIIGGEPIIGGVTFEDDSMMMESKRILANPGLPINLRQSQQTFGISTRFTTLSPRRLGWHTENHVQLGEKKSLNCLKHQWLQMININGGVLEWG